MDLNDLKAKYNIKPRPRYYDARGVKTFECSTPKGQFLFDLDIDGKQCTINTKLPFKGGILRGQKRFVCDSIADVASFIYTLDLEAIQDRVLPDEDIIKYLSKELGSKIRTKEIGNYGFIKWKEGIQLVDEHNILPWNIFKEGTGHQDNDYNLGPIMMNLEDFEAWLIKIGITQRKKPKAPSNRSMYD